MKKALIIASVASMIDQFNLSNIEILSSLGFQVEIATNFVECGNISIEKCEKLKNNLVKKGIKIYQVDFPRSPTKVHLLVKSINQVKHIAKNNFYNIVHCHSPVGGLAARYVFRKYQKNGTRIIYTAHGFHFYKGCPLKNWFIFYPVEKRCSKWTDFLITINSEDYNFALKKMKAKRVMYIPGVGIDIEKIRNLSINSIEKRKSIGVDEEKFLLLSVGELNNNKNHKIIIKSLKDLEEKITYVIAGKGKNKEKLEKLARENNVDLVLLGYRSDVLELYKCADCFCLPSIREGLNVSIMEAMANQLPVICSKIRGNIDLIDSYGGFLCNPFDSNDFRSAILDIVKRDKEMMGQYNLKKIENFSKEYVDLEMSKIYKNIFEDIE